MSLSSLALSASLTGPGRDVTLLSAPDRDRDSPGLGVGVRLAAGAVEELTGRLTEDIALATLAAGVATELDTLDTGWLEDRRDRRA